MWVCTIINTVLILHMCINILWNILPNIVCWSSNWEVVQDYGYNNVKHTHSTKCTHLDYCVCMCVCVYVCMCVCVYVYMCVCVYILIALKALTWVIAPGGSLLILMFSFHKIKISFPWNLAYMVDCMVMVLTVTRKLGSSYWHIYNHLSRINFIASWYCNNKYL